MKRETGGEHIIIDISGENRTTWVERRWGLRLRSGGSNSKKEKKTYSSAKVTVRGGLYVEKTGFANNGGDVKKVVGRHRALRNGLSILGNCRSGKKKRKKEEPACERRPNAIAAALFLEVSCHVTVPVKPWKRGRKEKKGAVGLGKDFNDHNFPEGEGSVERDKREST